jgi:hypothetical protein
VAQQLQLYIMRRNGHAIANQCIAFISVFRLLDDSSDLDVAFVGRPVPRAQISEMTNPMSFAMANANEQVMQLLAARPTQHSPSSYKIADSLHSL